MQLLGRTLRERAASRLHTPSYPEGSDRRTTQRTQSQSQAPPSSTQRTPEESVIEAGSSLWVLPTLPRTPPGQQHPQHSPSMSLDEPRSRRNRAALHIPQRKLEREGTSMALERRPESHEACAGTWAPRAHMHAHTLYTHTCVYLTHSHTHVHPVICSRGPLTPTAPLAGRARPGPTLIVGPGPVPPGSAWPLNAIGLRRHVRPRSRPDRWLRNTRREIY